MSEAAAATSTDAPAAPPPPETHAGALVTYSSGQTVLHPTRAAYLTVVKTLKDEGFNMCVDLCAVDYLDNSSRDLPESIDAERFEIVVNLLSHSQRRRVRVRVQVPGADAALKSLYELYPGVEAMEREAYDLMGIVFEGHPDLTRILMPEEWEGHPLRKDYAMGRIPVQFKGAPTAR